MALPLPGCMRHSVDTTYTFAEAREDYLSSAAGFQAAKGFRGRRGGTTMRLDGIPSWWLCDMFAELIKV